MNLLYKTTDEQVITCDINKDGEFLILNFYSDGGKFGTYETLDEFKLKPETLIQILQEHNRNNL
jgi:hypothetical protein